MSELEQLTKLIDVILSEDNQARKEAEALLKKIREENINGYNVAFATLMTESPKQAVRMFCVVHLRLVLSFYSEHSLPPAWTNLNNDTHKFLKNSFLQALNNEKDKAVKRNLCDLIGEIGATCQSIEEEDKPKLGYDGQNWDELMPAIMTCLDSSDPIFIECGLRILSVMFMYSCHDFGEYKDELFPIFKSCLDHKVDEVISAGVECLANYLEVVHTKHTKRFIDLIPVVFERTIQVLQRNEELAIDMLAHIQDIAETEPKLYKNHFNALFSTIKSILHMKVEAEGIKETALETIVILFERLPKFGQSMKDQLKEFLELIFEYMVKLEEDVDDEWCIPKEGFFEVNEDGQAEDASVKFCMHLIDRIIATLGEKTTIPILSGILIQMVKVDNWRYRHAALLALSQVGEYVQDLSEMEPIVSFILNFFEDAHPKVRYAACHAIGQISDDMAPEFQIKFLNTLLHPLLNVLNDQVPRVVSHGLAALTNLMEGCEKEDLKPHIEEVLKPLIHFLNNGISLVKENTLCAISALSEAVEEAFTPYWEKTAEIVFGFVKNLNQKEYKQLRGQSIECLTLIATAIGKDEFKKASHEVIMTLHEIQSNHIEEKDPQKNYILSGWQRICVVLQEDFIPYLETILPTVFDLVDNVIASEKKRVKELEADPEEGCAFAVKNELGKKPELPKFNVSTGESEEVMMAVDMINAFVEDLKAGYLDYVERTSNILIDLLSFNQNDKIRLKAAQGLAPLIVVVRDSKHANSGIIIKTMAGKFIEELWETIDSELNADQMAKLAYCMREVILAAGRFMDEKMLEAQSTKIFNCLEASEKRKDDNKKFAEEETDLDEDDFVAMEEENLNEEEFHCALAEVIGSLFATHKELTIPLVKLIYDHILPNVLGANQPPKIHKFGLFLIDDMIEHLGIELIPDMWPEISRALLKFTGDPLGEVRQAAVYGIGQLAEKSKDIFKEMATDCLKAIGVSYTVAKNKKEPEKDYGHSRDNATAALGQIIKNQASHLPDLPAVVNEWLKHLPLRFDKKEGRIQHELLVDIILESNASLIFGENGENMKHVLEIFAEITDTKFSTEVIKKKIVKVLNFLLGSPATADMVKKVADSLENRLKEKLKKLF